MTPLGGLIQAAQDRASRRRSSLHDPRFRHEAVEFTLRQSIARHDLMSCLFEERLFAVFSFTGYMDESVKDDKWFVLSVLVGHATYWVWVELAWQRMLEETNEALRDQGRQTLSRYKAADCSSLLGEFRGWTVDEQRALTQRIIGIFKSHPLRVISYSVNLRESVTEIPETKPNPKGFAYVLLLYFLMPETWEVILAEESSVGADEKITLVHDRCDYDGALLDAFTQMKNDPHFQYRDRFTTIAPMGWEDCIPLQPADLLAYENLKEAELKTAGRDRRKTLKLLLDLNSFGGRAKGINAEILRKLWSENLNESTKKIVLKAARIRSIRKSHRRASKSAPQRNKRKTARRKNARGRKRTPRDL